MLISRIPEDVQKHLDELKASHNISTNAKMVTFLIFQAKANDAAIKSLIKSLDHTRESYADLLSSSRDFVNSFSALKKAVKR